MMPTLHVQFVRRLIRAYSFSLGQVVSLPRRPVPGRGRGFAGMLIARFVARKTANHRQGRDQPPGSWRIYPCRLLFFMFF